MLKAIGRYGTGITSKLSSPFVREKKTNRHSAASARTNIPENLPSKATPTSLTDISVTKTRPTLSVQKGKWISKVPGANWIRQRLSHGSDKLFTLAQKALPHHTFSRLFGLFADCRVPFLKNLFINSFIWIHNINMEETKRHSAREFSCFNDFFTRKLQDTVRTTAPDGQVASPVDGTIGQIGTIENEQLIQAKGHTYNLTELLGGDKEAAELFKDGKYSTIYLSPSDYHHFHMAQTGKLLWTTHIPGKLFSVHPKTVRSQPKLFANNERLVAMFETDNGPMAMIMVGAINVSSIETTWGGLENPHGRGGNRHRVVHKDYRQNNIHLAKGQDAGDFKLGSTVICLFGNDCKDWLDNLEAGTKVKMGQPMTKPASG